MHLHRIVGLHRRGIHHVETDVGSGETCLEIAALGRRRLATVNLLRRGIRGGERRCHVYCRLIDTVRRAHERRRVHRHLDAFGDDEGDGLAVVVNAVILEQRQRAPRGAGTLAPLALELL